MRVQIESTTKIVELNGVPARIWEGITDSGIKVHCYVTRIAHAENEPPEVVERFKSELQETRQPSKEIEAIPLRMII